MRDPAADAAALAEAAAVLGVPLDGRQVEKLLAFGDMLLRWNQAFNLISRQDEARVLPRHLLDSLSVAGDVSGTRALDLGTGAGLPGVPLAIALERVAFTLVDRSPRRIRFVERAARELGLGNVSAVCADVRELPASQVFDTVLSRAVADLSELWTLAAPRLAPDGRIVVMHRSGGGSDDAAPQAPATSRIAERRTVRIPGLDASHEVVLLARRED